MMKTATMMDKLHKKFPNCTFWEGMDFDGSDCIMGGEGSNINGIPAFDYYTDDYTEQLYVSGVNAELDSFLRDNGWWAECYDPGTWKIWKD